MDETAKRWPSSYGFIGVEGKKKIGRLKNSGEYLFSGYHKDNSTLKNQHKCRVIAIANVSSKYSGQFISLYGSSIFLP